MFLEEKTISSLHKLNQQTNFIFSILLKRHNSGFDQLANLRNLLIKQKPAFHQSKLTFLGSHESLSPQDIYNEGSRESFTDSSEGETPANRSLYDNTVGANHQRAYYQEGLAVSHKTKKIKKESYNCRKCNRSFQTSRALGGHRNKSRVCSKKNDPKPESFSNK